MRWFCPAGREAGSKCPRLSRITVGITGYGEKSQPPQKIAQAVLRCIPWLSAIMFTLVTATYEAVSRNASVAKGMRLRQICRR
ncbi:hypothetical protein LF1_52540 [Rubripirellula obstinata]|uniref:Uncharacterized protein n=1 Tax=Rubripirellula obstinata TaxID=406547 RepID=A0A5B1CBN0_9BACT|nr:hypothetical protein LF1_52540 [Rubripirellula obstinata]